MQPRERPLHTGSSCEVCSGDRQVGGPRSSHHSSKLGQNADILMRLRPVFTVKEAVHWRHQNRRQSTMTSLFNICLSLTFPKEGFFGTSEPRWAKGQLWYCVYIYNTVKEWAGNSLRNINDVRLVTQKETEAVICKSLTWDLDSEPNSQSLGGLFLLLS